MTKTTHIKQGSILSSPLFRRFLAPIVLTMLVFTMAIYFFAVPYLKNLVYSLEEKSVMTNLNDIHSLIEANYYATEAYKKAVMAAHRREMKNITLFAETYLKNKVAQVDKGLISKKEAQTSALAELRQFKYGAKQENFVWVADYNGYFLSHPDPKMNKTDFSEVRDVFGNYILTPLIQEALDKGEGYHSYWWQRPGSDLPAEKLSYARVFPQWEWIIGTGVFIDDLQAEILLRKEKMIGELRRILKPIVVGKTGYIYIFDAWNNVIIHPDQKLENTDISSLINPVTKHKLVNDLIAASRTKSQKLVYKWNKPSDPKHYIYDKIDWVQHVKGFDWYIVASVYTDELNTSSYMLRNKILIIGAVVVLMSIFIVALLMGRLLMPIRSLSITAGRVEDGDLLARCDERGKDEISILGRAFNRMVERLRENIEELDHKVMERTGKLNLANKDLTLMVDRLERHNEEITYLNVLAEQLQACNELSDTLPVVADVMLRLFPQCGGMLAMADSKGEILSPAVFWGGYEQEKDDFAVSKCLAFKDNKIHLSERPGMQPLCEHIRPADEYLSLCLPLYTQSQVLGMIYLQCTGAFNHLSPDEKSRQLNHLHRLALTVTDQLSMAMANLRLMTRLQNLSVRDGLTGLFNRRYMEETMNREFQLAKRHENKVGTIMLDVDFFKKFNDTYGHEAGDLVLVELSRLMRDNVRKEDIVCRYGGEEFVIIMPSASLELVAKRAELIRKMVDEELRLEYNEHKFHVTISMGAACYPDHGERPDKVLKAADNALYQAKENGRNQVATA